MGDERHQDQGPVNCAMPEIRYLDLPDFGTLSTLLTDSRVAIDRLLARFPCQFLVVCENTVAAFY